jgi:D-glycero-D-manno-heptose 1,7-bisphosphate phosphatase
MTLRPAAFLDRDGVINLDRGYVVHVQDFEFVPGVLEACRVLARSGYALVVITNQSGIGRGLYSEANFLALSAWMQRRMADAGAPLAGIYHCPHHPIDALGEFRRECDCRKPAPGLLLRAERELGLDLARSILFGDKHSDLQAAAAAGVRHRFLLGTDGRAIPPDDVLATGRFRSLAAAVASSALGEFLAHHHA